VKRRLIEPGHGGLSIRRQCMLLGLGRSTWHYQPVEADQDDLRLMRRLDEQYLRTPFYGSRRMTLWLCGNAEEINRKRLQRLMRTMGIEAIYPKPRTTRRNPEHRVFPYLLRGVEIARPDHVWSTDITYVPMPRGFMYVLLRLPLAVRPIFEEWLARNYPEKADRVLALIRSTREGRLNNSQFGQRMRGQGPYAEQINQAFKIFKKKFGLDRGLPPLDSTQFVPPKPRTGQMRLF
jgi:HTH-like domain